MKKLISKTLLLVMLVTSVLLSCKKDNKGNKEPLMPPPESMFMDFSNFQALSNKSLTADDTTLYNNWTASAVTVGIWSSIVYLNSAIPVAAFREAFNHTGVFSENSTWKRTFSIIYLGGIYTCNLEGTAGSNTTEWKMYLSKAGGIGADYSNFLWFTGTSSGDATSATWHLNRGPAENGRPYFDIAWVKDMSLRYTLVDAMDAGAGNWLEYDKTGEAGLDSQFLIQTVNQVNNITIQWKSASKNGRVKCQNWYGDLNWHCWGVNYKNSICN